MSALSRGKNVARLGRVLMALVLALCVAPASGSLGSETPFARGARTIFLNESGHLHLTSKHNFTLNERGTASGTARGSIYVHLTAVSSSRVTVEVGIYPHGGSISGSGSGSYRRSKKTAYFNGTLSIGRGTGSYAHAHGSGLSFSGTIRESENDAITVRVSGRVSD